ncbi:MAG: copper homeostasis protein CutC [Arachnia sp.]
MRGLLEVIALHAADAERAEAGGADRIELVGTMESDGLSPTPQAVEKVRRSTTIQLRAMVRLRDGFRTDGGEATRLKGLIDAYFDAGADGVVLGFLDGHASIDREVMGELLAEGQWPWTFHRALDYCLDRERAWAALLELPRLDQVLTAGSVRGVEHGLDDLVARAKADKEVARLTMAGGSLNAEHVPWLVRSGVSAFHLGRGVRPGGSYKAYVDEALVGSWRRLVDDTLRHAREVTS